MDNVIDRTVERCFVALCHEAATPFAYRMLRHLRDGRWRDLCASAPDPRVYTCAKTYQADAMVGNFFKKYADFDLGVDLEKEARESFYKSEAQCYHTNERLSPFVHRAVKASEQGALDFIDRVRKEVSLVLGKLPATLKGKFGPGSTYGDIGKYTTLPDKMSSRPTITQGAVDLLPLWEETAWARYGLNRLARFPDYARLSPVIVKGNRFTTVPKDAFKRRGICIEGSVNLYYQLAVGGVIRQRLKSAGIDILTRQGFHRMLARLGSVLNNLATIDLSNASDTIAKVLVKLLLPTEWFDLLSSLRSPSTLVDGKWVRLEKFSSMGNGYTFELETLIFYAIARAVDKQTGSPTRDTTFHGDEVSCYGDDIIVPKDIASNVVAALEFFGLTVNKGKTFLDGKFKESCGGDYFSGLDVRPHFLNESPNEPQQLIALANGLFRCGINVAGNRQHRLPYHRAWLRLVDALPTAIRACKGPSSLGDIVIHQDEHRWSQNRRTRGSIHYLRCYRPLRPARVGWGEFKPGVVLASALYGSGDGADKVRDGQKFFDYGGVFPRQPDLLSHKLGWVACS
jgi:hypothetical protein